MDLSDLHQVLHWASEGKTRELENLFNQSLQLRAIGATVDLSDQEHPLVLLKEVQPMHLGGIGGAAVNGGIISMLVDLAIGLLGIPYYKEGLTATHHLSIHFVKPLMAKAIRLEAEKTHVLHNRVFGHVKVMNEKNEVCAYATGTVVKGIKKT